MRKLILLVVLVSLECYSAYGQESAAHITEMKASVLNAKTDTAKISALLRLGEAYRFSKLDSGIYYNNEALQLSRQTGEKEFEANATSNIGSIYLGAGNIPKALDYLYKALRIPGKAPSAALAGDVNNRIGNVYMELGEYQSAIKYYKLSASFWRGTISVYNEFSNIGNVYELMGVLDSANVYQQKAYQASITMKPSRYALVRGEMRQRMGNIEADLGHYDEAAKNYRVGLKEAGYDNDSLNLSILYLQMAKMFVKMNLPDSGFRYARKTLITAKVISMQKSTYEASLLLAGLFKQRYQTDSALKYTEMAAGVKDNLYGPKMFRQLEIITFNEQQRQQQLQEEKETLQNTYRMIALFSALAVFLLIAIILWRNNRNQKKANLQLSEQKEEILTQRDELGQTLTRLKSAQTQLIQSEKMASLGELTAGIAHEIQNPLNFVNNFSEVNTELIGEMKQEIDTGDLEEIKTIATDIEENSKKISMHGKRADAIVKGMLQHSQVGTGTKEPANLNALADECMRLAYHTLTAKDKSFNAVPIAIGMVTHFDETLPKINVIQRDMVRVMLNLFNNAFYAVNEKQKTAGENYKPEVSVSTIPQPPLASGGAKAILIIVKDNGTGIPDAIKDKIMQPFFTTKPTGEGTGLGLSLTYDMVVKGHGGSIEVNSVEGEGSEFTITLPV